MVSSVIPGSTNSVVEKASLAKTAKNIVSPQSVMERATQKKLPREGGTGAALAGNIFGSMKRPEYAGRGLQHRFAPITRTDDTPVAD
jgi:hypothetical protein